MTDQHQINDFLDKIKKMEKGHLLDLSSDEDLSIGIMNLIAIEEHLFFTGNKTGKTKYFDLINQVRDLRKNLLKMIIKDYEGEVWCTSKHLLAASMRVMEVGTKAQTKGDNQLAYDLFQKSYDLYNLFWALNLGLLKDKVSKSTPSTSPTLTANGRDSVKTFSPLESEPNLNLNRSDLMGKVSGIIGKILNCCRE